MQKLDKWLSPWKDLNLLSECQLSDDAQTVAIAQSNGVVAFYDLEKSDQTFTLSATARPPWQYNFETKNTKIKFLSTFEVLVSSTNRVKVYDLRSKEIVKEYRQQPVDPSEGRSLRQTRSITAVSGDYCRIMGGNRSGGVSLWDRRYGTKPLRQWNIGYELSEVTRKKRIFNGDMKIQSIQFNLSKIFSLSSYSLSCISFWRNIQSD